MSCVLRLALPVNYHSLVKKTNRGLIHRLHLPKSRLFGRKTDRSKDTLTLSVTSGSHHVTHKRRARGRSNDCETRGQIQAY